MSETTSWPGDSAASAAADAAHLVVHVVDDDEAVRRSLALLLGSFGHSTCTYPSAEAFLAALDGIEPGCVIVDIRMPGMDGLGLQQELKRRGASLPVVVVTGHAEVALAVQAMKAGAVDFIEKPYSEEDILRAVAAALTRVVDEQHQRAVTDQAAARIAALTPRERDVLRRLVDGWPNKVIAHELGISPRTVEIHRANVMEKLGCRSLAEAVRIALAAGFGEG
ncbi:response regulator FixJ [Limobrevibacterium gyesilva]|uniref:Response regulator FixJ n=1 Tax=Limobrevibacterium gyesilva TaxID=2991712 RepID=A0AA41YID6_9PROT|nr:response regulator FixJ [Limobrevibacterium gyesilva]MCW3474096.1 response regulator FixJ [Limobrevibacterium gyesilva]